MKQNPWLYFLPILLAACQNKAVLGPGFGEPLKIVSVSPDDGATSVGAGEQIRVTFNQKIETGSVSVQTSGSSCTGSIQISSDNFATCVPLVVVTTDNPTLKVRARDGFEGFANYKLRITTALQGPKGGLSQQYQQSAGFTIFGSWELRQNGGGGNVMAMVLKDGIAYLAGIFDYAGPKDNAKNFAFLNTDGSLQNIQKLAKANGQVKTAIADGAGGFYIGGSFTAVNGQSRRGVARINSDGSLHAFALTIFQSTGGSAPTVTGLALDGNTLYLVGNPFNSINGTTRNCAAAVDVTTMTLTAFDPNLTCNGVSGANAIVVATSTVYIGGSFNLANGGTTRNMLAEFDKNSGIVTAFHPNFSGGTGFVNTLVLTGTTIYVGGGFNTANFGNLPAGCTVSTRNNVAEISRATSCATAFNPNFDDANAGTNEYVYSMVLSGTTLYVGGQFLEVNRLASSCGGGTLSRNGFAAVLTTTGCATTFNPTLATTTQIVSLLLSGTNLHFGGTFLGAIGSKTYYYGILDTVSQTQLTGLPAFAESVSALALSGSNILAGGNFSSAGGYALRNLAAYDIATGVFKNWSPTMNVGMNAMAIIGTTIFLAPTSTGQLNGSLNGRFFAANINTGATVPFTNCFAFDSAGGNNKAYAIEIYEDRMYVGGVFGSSCAYDTKTLAQVAFSPTITGGITQEIRSFAFGNGKIYMGGAFTGINGQTRNYLGSFDLATYALNSYHPSMNSDVLALLHDGTTLYAGGNFDVVGTQYFKNFAAIDPETAAPRSLTGNAGGTISTLSKIGAYVYLGGSFTTINDKPRANFAALDTTTGGLTDWNPNASSAAAVIKTDGKYIYAGGQFTSIGGQSRNYFAILDPETGLAR